MKTKNLQQLTADWQQMTHDVLALKRIPLPELQALLKETYAVLTAFCKNKLVPKEMCRIFLEIESFLYFAFLMEDKEVGDDFYYYRKVYTVAEALKSGFFSGNYTYAFPKLEIADDNNNLSVFDFEADCLENIAT